MKIIPDGYWKLVGHFAVDAGIVWIGDPCYILHSKEPRQTLGKDWPEFCSKLGDDFPTAKVFGFVEESDGLGICLSTGWGDGEYPVYARIVGGRVMQIFIDFDETEDIYNENTERDED
jgi:hypothetical protein